MIDKNLWNASRSHQAYLVVTMIAGFWGGILILSQAYVLADVVHQAFILQQGLDALKWELAGLLLIVTLRAVTSWLEGWSALKLARLVREDLRQAVLQKIENLGPVQIKSEQTGELLNILTEGLDRIHSYCGQYLPQLFKAALLPILFLGFIFPRDWPSGLILLITAPLLPLFMVLIGKWAEHLTQQQWQLLSRMSGYFKDLMQGLATLKLLNQSRRQGAKVEQISEDFRHTSLSVLRIAFLSALSLELLSTLSIALVAVGLGLRLVQGQLVFSIAFFLLLLAPEFYLPIRNLGSYYHTSLNGVATAGRIFEFLAAEPKLTNPALTNHSSAFCDQRSPFPIVFDQVSLHYAENEKPALQQISFSLAAGEKIALVGPSGSGKTTILYLLLGFMPPSAGHIRVNGLELGDWDLELWRRQIAWISPHPYLFAGSIRDNLLLGHPDLDEAEMIEACIRFGLHSLITELPENYDTPIGPGGRELSGGQRQLIAIVRAWLKNAPLLLLDEATAHLDLMHEAVVQQALQELIPDKSVLAVAHRLTTVTQMDRILLIEQGHILATGSHQELSMKPGPYRTLLQARGCL